MYIYIYPPQVMIFPPAPSHMVDHGPFITSQVAILSAKPLAYCQSLFPGFSRRNLHR